MIIHREKSKIQSKLHSSREATLNRSADVTSFQSKGFGPAILESRTLALNTTLGTVSPSAIYRK
jgi:hypothetical protein